MERLRSRLLVLVACLALTACSQPFGELNGRPAVTGGLCDGGPALSYFSRVTSEWFDPLHHALYPNGAITMIDGACDFWVHGGLPGTSITGHLGAADLHEVESTLAGFDALVGVFPSYGCDGPTWEIYFDGELAFSPEPCAPIGHDNAQRIRDMGRALVQTLLDSGSPSDGPLRYMVTPGDSFKRSSSLQLCEEGAVDWTL